MPDNLKSGVHKPGLYDADINPTYQEIAAATFRAQPQPDGDRRCGRHLDKDSVTLTRTRRSFGRESTRIKGDPIKPASVALRNKAVVCASLALGYQNAETA
ncbi:hypothetical protein RI103_38230 (plasmid) [Paraburkholderia sp. FT54]|uniref:hypothetical protein n=1 Tax=Paraburkholderia sp. FT54 TaxID=3074437 RepID=UPI002877E28F|nr:hypothetical protein [Paraburkholderia sp. FT54]WNC95546.1 hypothetical protein RI103_38230 [Paraburkholderia sp. FT54]